MPYLYQYLIKFSISLAVLYTFYYVVLRPLTFYQWNRMYLVCYSLLSFVIPFIDISSWLVAKNIDSNYLINSIPAVNRLASPSFNATGDGENFFNIMLSWDFAGMLFLVGATIMLVRIVYQYLSLRAMKRKAVLLKTGEFEFYDVNGPITPFSFANAIFINSRLHSEEEFHKILEHEFVHVKQHHTVDIVVSEIVCIVNWFNPFAWLIRKAVRQNLEFIADKNVLDGGIEPRRYQYLLLKVMGLPQYSITNNFSFSSLKKRIVMMNKIKTARVHLVKFLFAVPLLSLLLLAFRNKINFKEDALVLTYAGIIIDATDHQPLKNIVIKELTSNTKIKTDERGFFKLTVPVIDEKAIFKINILKDGNLKKEFKINWVKFAPRISESFIGLVSVDKENSDPGKCDQCFVYQDQVVDKNGLFVKDISYETAQKKLYDYLQTRNDLKILAGSDNPITRIGKRLYISSISFKEPELNSNGLFNILIVENNKLPLIYKDGLPISFEKFNTSTKGIELKQIDHLNQSAAREKYGIKSEIIDITTYSGMGSDTIPRAPVPPVPPVIAGVDSITFAPVAPVSPATPAEAIKPVRVVPPVKASKPTPLKAPVAPVKPAAPSIQVYIMKKAKMG